MNIYKKLDYIWYLLFVIYNFFVKVSLFFRPKLKKLLKNNKNLKRNKDYCFILGNGPSLGKIDLLKLNDEDTFAVNYFYEHCPDGFESKFFVAVDQVFYKTEKKKYLTDLYKRRKNVTFILKSPAYNMRNKWDMKRTFFVHPKLFQYGDFVSCDCTSNMTACINVVLQCIEIALYMGYKKIYLLGCDFSQYAEINSHHFYDTKNDDDRRNLTNMGDDARWAYLVHYHHYALEKYAKLRGQEIVNLSEGSLIDAYRSESFENVLKTVKNGKL